MTPLDSDLHTISRGLGTRYYRLALSEAVRRNLRGAVIYARYAAMLDPEHRNAVQLLRLCRYELGESDDTKAFPEESLAELTIHTNSEESLEKIKLLGAEKKWREAARAVRVLPHQSVRVLNMQGCLWALAGNRPKAADCFAQALRKDRFNRLAAEGLAELPPKRRFLWGILGEIV
jgi:tetratricopeptide (TPR) repeat protein